MARYGAFLWVACGVGALLVGCSQGGGGGGAEMAPHSLGRSWFVQPTAQATTAVPFHGDAYAKSPGECQRCHSPITQFCSRCHFGQTGSKVPPGSAWVHGNVPHGFTAEGPVCNGCHERLRQFGAGPTACHDCHAGGQGQGASHPRGKEWMDKTLATFHGKQAGPTAETCKACHGADLKGGSAGVSCFSCHFTQGGSRVPAGVSWQHGTVPHASLAAQEAVCNACHTVSRQYGLGPAGCHDCHVGSGTGQNHPTGQAWMDKRLATFHGKQAGATADSCKACHGADLRGGSVGVSCFECHFTQAGARVPAGTSWQHGTVPHAALAAQEAVCNACHTVSRQYGLGPAGCHDCHVGSGTGQSHPVGQAWMDKKLASFHGRQAGSTAESCKACHGADLRGGSVGVSCFACHFTAAGARAPAGWTHGRSGHEDRESPASVRTVCQACHDTNRTYGNRPTCHNCH